MARFNYRKRLGPDMGTSDLEPGVALPARAAGIEEPPAPLGLPSYRSPRSASEADEHRRGGWRVLLRNRRFLLFEASAAFASAGYAVYSVSVLFLAYGLSGNLEVAGAVLCIEYGVYTATFLIAPLVDRVPDKRSLLLIGYPVQAVVAVLLALELISRTISVPVLLGLVFVLALVWDFLWAVYMIAPRLIVEQRQLFLADGVASVVSVGTQIGGYSGGAALLYFLGPYGGASAYALLLVAALVAALPLTLPVERPPRTPFRTTFRRGWEAFRGRTGRALRAFAAFEVAAGFFAAIPALLLPAVAYAGFADPTSTYGALVTSLAVGGAIAGIVVGHLNPRSHVGRLLVVTPFLAGVCVLLLGPATASVVTLALLLGATGAAFSVRNTAKYTWVQGTYPPEALGRLTSNLYLFSGGAATAAVLVIGELSARLALSTLELVDGFGLLATGALALGIPAVRRMAF